MHHPSPARIQIMCDRLPLVVYREVVAHLRQLPGVQAGLLPQTSQTFDYLQSQVGGLWYEVDRQAGDAVGDRLQQILQHYGDRYGAWTVIPS
ncbi:MAG: hypothetical protein KME20_20765 [Kaiparowitsia implicata GSE-PSE-MK54-09C]|nr:hypothetical protein [Kaiparowitsia implicata GSE-PSE-MK54-09C]